MGITMNGQNIKQVMVLYEHVQVKIRDQWYKLSTNVILQMVNEFEFEVVQKRKYKYLVNPESMKQNGK